MAPIYDQWIPSTYEDDDDWDWDFDPGPLPGEIADAFLEQVEGLIAHAKLRGWGRSDIMGALSTIRMEPRFNQWSRELWDIIQQSLGDR